MIIVEGHHETAAVDVGAALADLAALLADHQPGYRGETFELSADDRQAEEGQGTAFPG